MSRRGELLLLALCGALLGARPVYVLSPRAEVGFNALAKAVRETHALGGGVHIEQIPIREHDAEIDLIDNGARVVVVLERADDPCAAPCSRWFALRTTTGPAPPSVVAMPALLDQAFPDDPWSRLDDRPRPATPAPAAAAVDYDPLAWNGRTTRRRGLLSGAALVLALGVAAIALLLRERD